MFSGKSKADNSRAGGASLSFIGAETIVTGDIETASHLHIDGRVQGDIKCAMLVEGAGGTIVGNIVAEEAQLAGLVDGTVTAGTLVLEASARVTGDVRYDTLSIVTGAEVDGRFTRRTPTLAKEAPAAEIARPSQSPAALPELLLTAESERAAEAA